MQHSSAITDANHPTSLFASISKDIAEEPAIAKPLNKPCFSICTGFITSVVEHWLEQEIAAQLVHHDE